MSVYGTNHYNIIISLQLIKINGKEKEFNNRKILQTHSHNIHSKVSELVRRVSGRRNCPQAGSLVQSLNWVVCCVIISSRLKVKVKSLNLVQLFVTPWTVACKAPPSMGFCRQEYWSGCHCLLQGIFPTQWSNPGLPHCRQTLLPSEPPGKSF